MFEQLLKLYYTYMISGVTSPMPHFVGPPGSGKSTVFKQLADMLGVNLHIVNVSRISPLGLEGLELPDSDRNALTLLISEMWTKAKEGDIYLFDEFLRGFPEVYNGLLDIFTGREVGATSCHECSSLVHPTPPPRTTRRWRTGCCTSRSLTLARARPRRGAWHRC